MRRKNLAVLVISIFFLSRTAAQDNGASKRYDSLSRTGSVHDDRPVPSLYIFDSLFIISEKLVKKNFRLAGTITYSKLIFNSQDSNVFYVKTGRTVYLNGKLLGSRESLLDINNCPRIRFRIISANTLRRRYGFENANGAYFITCE